MTLTIERLKRRDKADYNELGHAALTYCRAIEDGNGVHSSLYYWANTDTIAIVTDADPGAYRNGSGGELDPKVIGAELALSDLARSLSIETLVDGRAGDENYKLEQLSGARVGKVDRMDSCTPGMTVMAKDIYARS